MKKTIIALAIAGMTTTVANAQPVFENKDTGTKIDIDGRISVQLRNDKIENNGVDAGNRRTDFADKGSRVRVRAFQKISEDWTALYAAEARFTTQADKAFEDLHIKRMFGGFQYKPVGTLTFGKQLLNGDNLGAADYTYELGAIVKLTTAANKSFNFISSDFNGFRLGIDYMMGESSNKNGTYSYNTIVGYTPIYSDDTLTTISGSQAVYQTHTVNYSAVRKGQGFNIVGYYDKKFGDIQYVFEVGYGQVKAGQEFNKNSANYYVKSYNQKSYGAGLSVRLPQFWVGFDYAGARSPYGQSDHTFRVGNAKFAHLDQFELGLKYLITAKDSVYSEILFGSAKTNKEDDKAKFFGWFLGVDHKFTDNVIVYVEGGKFQTKQSGTKINNSSQIALGTRIMF